jgi:hypothetical protein
MAGERDGTGGRRYRRRAVLATVGVFVGCVSLGDRESTDRSKSAATGNSGAEQLHVLVSS